MTVVFVACADNAGDEQAGTDTTVVATDSVAAVTPDNAANSSGMLDPNTAGADQIAAIPGLTPELAQAVVRGRPYQDMRGVNQVLTGLTEQQRDTVYTRLWKPLDLNNATAAEIELIPGVGPRMRHEFEEYRPYTSLEQFRREIGKYVDETEVARLEKYVAIRPAGQ
jgi:DNA uptake protein ComE-like DNA-binding protein